MNTRQVETPTPSPLDRIENIDLDSLPPELTERFPEVVEQLRTGVIETVPDQALSQLPGSVVDRIPDSLLASNVNTTFVLVLAVITALALLGFGYGMVKAAAKASLFFLVLATAAGALLYVQL